ncbi:MAG: hypothetical protein IIA06_08335, partial [Proteobacteria bacterium]|nr:hypothetical protein [Pseudomonadota bacterium]
MVHVLTNGSFDAPQTEEGIVMLSSAFSCLIMPFLLGAVIPGNTIPSPAETILSPAATITWTGDGDGTSWHDEDNWDLVRVPGAGDDVSIPDVGGTTEVVYSSGSASINTLSTEEDFRLTSGTLTIDAASSANGAYTQTGGTLTGAGDLTISGQTTWNGGTMSGSGTTIANGGLTMGTTGFKTLNNGRTLENHGAAVWSNGHFDMQDGAV